VSPKRRTPGNPPPDAPFWKRKRLSQMTRKEWESLCDGCARCCLLKLEDVDTGEIAYTDIACRLLDTRACRCTHYEHRQRYVPDCIRLDAGKVDSMGWLPSTCAYRLVAEGRDLYDWHPLVSGDPDSVHRAGISIRDRVVREQDDFDPEDRIVTWPE
jgi:uncharacterized cysteine cluster protein YcgN (CxxCxxCC family)